jgi:integrase
LYSSKTKKWRTIRAPSAASLIAERKVADQQDSILVLPCSDHRIRKILKKVSESAGIRYGQNVMDGWCPHDLRHTCLTNLAVAGVPLNGIKEYAGHASIVETQRYLKFMPESIELAARQSTRLAQLTEVRFDSQVRTRRQSK